MSDKNTVQLSNLVERRRQDKGQKELATTFAVVLKNM